MRHQVKRHSTAALFSTFTLSLLCGWMEALDVPYNNETHVVTCVPGVRANCASRYLGNTNTT